MVAIRKTCGAGGQNWTQLQPTNRHTSWSGESSTPGLGRQAESELSSVYVNDGFWDDGVCIDYRICLMGHNSLQDCQGSVVLLNCELCNPYKSTRDIQSWGELCGCLWSSNFNDVSTNTSILKTSSCSCKTEDSGGLVLIGVRSLFFQPLGKQRFCLFYFLSFDRVSAAEWRQMWDLIGEILLLLIIKFII